jgi:hypothetical protein
MAYALPEDVSKRHIGEELDAQVLAVVGVRLDDAERLIKTRIPDLDDRITAGSLDEESVKQVEADMILRLIRNPEGYTQESDGNYSYMISAAVASGRLEVREDEWRLLGMRRGVFTISTLPRMPWAAT